MMNISRVKYIIISLLILLAAYQTHNLWFEESVGGNIISILLNRKSGELESGIKKYFAHPYRIVYGNNNRGFFVDYGEMKDNLLRELCDEILIAALKNGNQNHNNINWEIILSEDVVVYEYAFEMPSAIFMESLGQKNTALSHAMEKFMAIAILPDEQMGINAFFLNPALNSTIQLHLKEAELYSEFAYFFDGINWDNERLIYRAGVLSDLDGNNNFFIPHWGNGGYYYNTGQAQAIYYDSNIGVEKSVIRANMLSFFDNPSAVYDATTDTIAFSDENAIVKYYSNDVLEYVSYKRNSKNTDILDDYGIAMDFITKRDLLIKNDFYLSGYEEKDGERRFYFDYILNGMPVILSNDLKEYIKEYTSNGISVTIKDGNLVNYTRLAYAFTVENTVRSSMSEISPLDYMNAVGMDIDEYIRVTFGYKADALDPITNTISMGLFTEFVTRDAISFIVE